MQLDITIDITATARVVRVRPHDEEVGWITIADAVATTVLGDCICDDNYGTRVYTAVGDRLVPVNVARGVDETITAMQQDLMKKAAMVPAEDVEDLGADDPRDPVNIA